MSLAGWVSDAAGSGGGCTDCKAVESHMRLSRRQWNAKDPSLSWRGGAGLGLDTLVRCHVSACEWGGMLVGTLVYSPKAGVQD